MTVRPVRKKSKNPSYFSHEFIISNHGDIVSFFAMIIVMGLLYKVSLCSPYVIASQGTHSLSSTFLFIQHNVTDEGKCLLLVCTLRSSRAASFVQSWEEGPVCHLLLYSHFYCGSRRSPGIRV